MKKRFMVLLALCLTLVMIMTGCGKGKVDSPDIGEDNGKNPGNEVESGSIKKGGDIVVLIEQDVDFLDIQKAVASGTDEIMFNIFQGLMMPTPEGGIVNGLAESHVVSEDGLTYTFKLRDAKFHDGSPVTAEDVKYSFDRYRGVITGTPLRSELINVDTIETPDDKTIVINMKQLDTSFLMNLHYSKIVPKSNEANFDTYPIGTGPFKFVEHLPEQRLVFERFDDYWDVDGIAHIDKVEFRIIPDAEAAFLSFQAGEIDMFPRLSTDKVDQLGDDFINVSFPSNAVQLLAINNAVEPFDDIRVRKAINYAIDVDEVIEAIVFGNGVKLGSNMSPVMAEYYQEGLENVYDLNLDEAKKLLKEAGYENGFKTVVTVPSNYPTHIDAAQVIIQQLAKVGIEVEMELVEWGVWLERVYRGREHEMTVIGFTGFLDPFKVLKKYISTDPANFVNFKNAEYDEMLSKVTVEQDLQERIKSYKRAQAILNEEAVCAFLMDQQFNTAMKKNIGGYKTYSIYVQDMAAVYYINE